MRFGIMIGRFQPPHWGHIAIMRRIIHLGLKPIVILGSSQGDRDMIRNPLNTQERIELWKLIFPDDDIIFLNQEDRSTYEEWVSDVLEKIRIASDNASRGDLYIYTGYKDKATAKYNRTKVANDFDVFYNYEGFSIDEYFVYDAQELLNPATGEPFHATDIRANFIENRCSMPEEAYNRLLSFGWGKRKAIEEG